MGRVHEKCLASERHSFLTIVEPGDVCPGSSFQQFEREKDMYSDDLINAINIASDEDLRSHVRSIAESLKLQEQRSLLRQRQQECAAKLERELANPPKNLDHLTAEQKGYLGKIRHSLHDSRIRLKSLRQQAVIVDRARLDGAQESIEAALRSIVGWSDD